MSTTGHGTATSTSPPTSAPDAAEPYTAAAPLVTSQVAFRTALPPPATVTQAGTAATSATPSTDATGSGHSVSDLILGVLLSGAVVAAVVNIILSRRKSLEEERARIRTTCAKAFEVVAAYKEFPYAIRRRRGDAAAEERIRLSDELRHIQARLSYFTVWMRGEDATLSGAFDELVRDLRQVAGRACHDAWLAPAADSDAAMNFPPGVVDLSELTQSEDAYIAAVKNHLNRLIKTRRIISFRRRRLQ